MVIPSKQGKISGYIEYRVRVAMADGRTLVGTLTAFDTYMNLVLADTEEFRRSKKKTGKTAGESRQQIEGTEKRSVGLAIVRGKHVVSIFAIAKPTSDPASRLRSTQVGGASSALSAGPGVARSGGRGMPSSLQGPAPGAAGGFGGFGPPPGFGRGGPGGPPGFGPPPGFSGGPPGGFPGQGRGFPPPGFAGR